MASVLEQIMAAAQDAAGGSTAPAQAPAASSTLDQMMAAAQAAAEEPRGFFGELGSSLASGALGIGSAVLNTADMLVRAYEHPAMRAGREQAGGTTYRDIAESLQEVQQTSDVTRRIGEYEIKNARWWVRGLGEIVPQMAVTVGATLASGGVAGFAIAASLEGGNAYDEALDAGASQEQATRVGVLVGAVNGVLEYLPQAALMKRAKKAISGTSRSGLTKRLVKAIIGQATEEGVTEAAQQVVQEYAAKMGYGADTTGLLRRTVEAGLLGGAAGALFGVGGDIAASLIKAKSSSRTDVAEAMGVKPSELPDTLRTKQQRDDAVQAAQKGPDKPTLLHAGLEIPGMSADFSRALRKVRALFKGDDTPRTPKQNSALHAMEGRYDLDESARKQFKLAVTDGRTDTSAEFTREEATGYMRLLRRHGKEMQGLAEKPTIARMRGEQPQAAQIQDPVLRDFAEELERDEMARRSDVEPSELAPGQIWDLDLTMHDLTEKTGVPFFESHQHTAKQYRDNIYDSNQMMKGLLKDTGLTMSDVLGNQPHEERLFNYLATGLRPEGMTDAELEIGQRIQRHFQQFERLVKRARFSRWERTGELAPDATEKLMREGKDILDKQGATALDTWLDDASFGVRELYVPTHGKASETNLGKVWQRAFGRGFTQTRLTEEVQYDPEHPLYGDIYRYTLRGLNIEKLEPLMRDLEGLFRESGVREGLMQRYFDNMYGVFEPQDFTGWLTKGMRQFYRVHIPQKVVKWVVRNLAQPTAYVLPKTFEPFDPIFWKNVTKMYTGAARLGALQERFGTDPAMKEHFQRYVTSLDAARQHYLLQELSEWELPRNLYHMLDTVAKAYSWSDTVNRANTWMYGYDVATQALERYGAKPTARNWRRFLNVSGAVYAPQIEQRQMAALASQGDLQGAAALAADRLSNSTQFRYPRVERGLAWQKIGHGAHQITPIATYAKGLAQQLYRDGIQPVSRGLAAQATKKGTTNTRNAMFKGARFLLGWYAASLLLNQLFEKMWDIKEGPYGLTGLRYVPGGPVLKAGIRTADAMWGGLQQNPGWDYQVAVALDSAGDLFVPFYHLFSRMTAEKKGLASWSPARAIRDLLNEAIAKRSGSRNVADQRRWVERNSVEQVQRLVFGGSWTTQKSDLVATYIEFLNTDDAKKKASLRDKLNGMLRKYPVSTKRKNYPRDVQYIHHLVPSLREGIRKAQ